MMMTGMTRKQAEVLKFVKAFVDERGFSPSFDEIGRAVSLRSKSGVSRLVHALAQRGHITFIPAHARTITINTASPISAAPVFITDKYKAVG